MNWRAASPGCWTRAPTTLPRRSTRRACRRRAQAALARYRRAASSRSPRRRWASTIGRRHGALRVRRALSHSAGGARARADRRRLRPDERRHEQHAPTSTLGLLTDDLPINAYLDKDFDSWLKRYVALIAWLCIAFSAAAAATQIRDQEAAPAGMVGAHACAAEGARAPPAGVGAARHDPRRKMGHDRRPLSHDEARGAGAASEAHAGVGEAHAGGTACGAGALPDLAASSRLRSARK